MNLLRTLFVSASVISSFALLACSGPPSRADGGGDGGDLEPDTTHDAPADSQPDVAPDAPLDAPADSPADSPQDTPTDVRTEPGATCGTRGALPCAPGDYCDWPDDSCGAVDRPGTSKPRPTFCVDVFAPVCGCDGGTYSNECYAARAGTDVLMLGPCR